MGDVFFQPGSLKDEVMKIHPVQKMTLIPVRRGYWGNRIGQPHTMPMKVHGKCGSVRVRLIPAPRGSGVVGSPTMKKMMAFSGVSDIFTCSCGHTRTKAISLRPH